MMLRCWYRASVAASLLLLPALSGCVLHKQSPPPVIAVPLEPEPAPSPLYSSELSQGNQLPVLPPLPLPTAQPAPPPQSEIQTAKKRPSRRTRGHKDETEVAERESRDREAKDKEAREKENAAAAADQAASGDGASAAKTESDAVAKVTTQTPTGDTAVPTPIGELTAGPSTDTTESRKQAVDLIQNTQRGVNGLHRNLSGDESKTLTQIRSFLLQAQHALHNGDVDGAYTLATKAKVLLTELTGSS